MCCNPMNIVLDKSDTWMEGKRVYRILVTGKLLGLWYLNCGPWEFSRTKAWLSWFRNAF